MLKNLLKYEFKATSRTYGGLYLIWVLVALVMGISMRGEVWNGNGNDLWSYLMLAYTIITVAVVVLCAMTIINRFTKNLLGREGYLMHTLPVSENQLIASKLISSMVWVVLSAIVGVLSLVMTSVGICAFRKPEIIIEGKTVAVGWGEILKIYAPKLQNISIHFWGELLWFLIFGLVDIAVFILCVYASCMIGHQFKKHSTVASILTFFLLQIVQGRLRIERTSYVVGAVSALPQTYSVNRNTIIALLVTIAFGVAYYAITSWLMKNKLDLE